MTQTLLRACLTAALLLAAASSAQDRPQLLVYSLKPRGTGALEAEAATAAVVRGIRQLDVFQVISSDDIRELLAMERSRQLYGEDGATDVGTALGARHAVVGSMTTLDKQVQVDLRLFDTQTSQVINAKSTGPLGGMPQVAAQLPALAQELLAPLLQAQQGMLVVSTNEEAAEVVVDDVLVASTPMREPVKLPRGSHRLQVRKDGFIAQSRTVKIEPDALKLEELSLVPSADYAEAWAIRHGRIRRGAYLAGGIALGAIVGGIAFDRLSTEAVYQDEFRPRQLWLRAQAGELPPEKPAFASQRASDAWDGCAADPAECERLADQKGGQVLIQQLVSGGLLALGVGGLGFATYYYFQGEDPNRYAKLVAELGPGPGGGPGLTLTLSW